MNWKELTKLVVDAKSLLATDVTQASGIEQQTAAYAQAFVEMHDYCVRWKNSTDACNSTGKTSPCTYPEDSDKCFGCGQLRLQPARDEAFNMQTEVDDLHTKRTETKRLAGMLVRSTGGREELAWVEVYAREIMAQMKGPGES